MTPGDSLAIAEQEHAVDDVDRRALVIQQNVLHDLLIEKRQV